MSVPCQSCGGPADDETSEEVFAAQYLRNGLLTDYPAPQPRQLGRCDECGTRRAVCLTIMEAHPAARRRLGGLSYAVDRLDSAVSALDATGVNVGWANIERLTVTDSDLWALLELGEVGDKLSWRNQMVPVERGLRRDTRRWGWIDGEARSVLNSAVALFFARRLEVPEQVGPPPGGAAGCLVCGRSRHLIKPSLQAKVWGPLRELVPVLVGGAPGPRIAGYACGYCTPNLPELGAGQEIELRHVQKSLLRFVGAGDEFMNYEFDLMAWAVSGAEPVVEPWSWLDYSELTEEMKPKPQGQIWINPMEKVG